MKGGFLVRDLNVRYLERLSDLYPTIAEASTEVINLEAILNLPKGTCLLYTSPSPRDTR